MNWFKNLNAAPRLLLSFGLLIVLIAAISCLAIINLSQANDRISALYQKDMAGLGVADELAIARLSLGRVGRDAILNMRDAAVATADDKEILSALSDIHASLDQGDKLFYSKEGVALIATIREAMPEYEKSYRLLIERVNANDSAGALASLAAANTTGRPLFQAVDDLRRLKQSLGQKKFQVNQEQFQTARWLLLSAATIGLLLGVALSIFIARGLSIPLGLTAAALEQMAAGDLTASVEVRTKEEVGRMSDALNRALEKLRSTLQDVAESAANSDTSSRELAAAAEEISKGAQEQAASLEETTATLEQITAAVRQSADNARQASQLATGSRESAEKGQEVVSSAIAAMAEINTASAKIFDIISTINEIAFQTNLLAVNAAVEAARAGEEGRGFAVVATEVRSLAQRSAEAAKEIKGLIQNSLEKVEKGSELVNRSGATLQGIVASVKRVTEIVGEIAAASAEQSIGVEQVSTAVTQMDHVTQSNSAQTQELSSTAQILSGQAARLTQLVGHFKLQNYGRSRGDNSRQPPLQGSAQPGAAQRRPATVAHSAANGRKQLTHPAALVHGPPAGSERATL
jgi:methyl-accepting chemotaxis protein